MKPLLLAEITGPYGPASIPERILQKIWWRGDFNHGSLRTTTGAPLRCLRPGRWNHAEGPDFVGASLEIGGELVRGDVEVHFYAGDWREHGHDADPAFDNVVLHVLLFPPRDAAVPLATLSGRRPPALVLLPHLREDLEDYANRDALLALESRDGSGWHAALLSIPEEERPALLREKSGERWRQKVRFARQRLEGAGWEAACHQLVLEALGLSRNRAPMSALAIAHPLAQMASMAPEVLYDGQRGNWRLAALRPGNHPLRRLCQYRAILDARPDWPADLLRWAAGFLETAAPAAANAGAPTARFRRECGLGAAIRRLACGPFAGAVGGSRLNTIAVDVVLPLLAARDAPPGAGGPASPSLSVLHACWHHWPLGDVPDSLARALRGHIPPGGGGERPVLCNGLFQGLLQLGHENG
jgi:hypothetical protein